MKCALTESASTVRDESAPTGAAHGHGAATASLPPHRSAEQKCAQRHNGEPALHRHIIALTGREEKGSIYVSTERWDMDLNTLACGLSSHTRKAKPVVSPFGL